MSEKSDNVYIGDLPADIDEATVQALFSRCTVTSLKFMPPKTQFPGAKAAALVRFGSVEEAEWIVEHINGNIPEGLTTPVIAKYAHTPDPAAKGASFDKGAGKAGGGKPVPPPPFYGKADAGKAAFNQIPPVRQEPYDASKGKGKGKAKAGAGGGGKSSASSSDFMALQNGLLEHHVLPGGKGPMPPQNQLFVKGLPPSTTDLDLYKLFGPFGAIPAKGIKVMFGPDGSCRGDGFVDFVDANDALKAVNAINSTPQPEGQQVTVTIKQGNGKGKGKGKDDFKGKGKF